MTVYFNSSLLLLEFEASFEPTKLCVQNCLKHQITHLKSIIMMFLRMRITLFGPPILGTFVDAIVSSCWETSWENLLVERLLVWKELSILVHWCSKESKLHEQK